MQVLLGQIKRMLDSLNVILKANLIYKTKVFTSRDVFTSKAISMKVRFKMMKRMAGAGAYTMTVAALKGSL